MKLVTAFPPGRVPLRSRYEPNLIEALKQLPGCSWDPKNRFWWIPTEFANYFLALGSKYRAEPVVVWPRNNETKQKQYALTKTLYPFQQTGVTKALTAGRYFLSWETGLGKTLGALECAKQLTSQNMLVVCPAVVRRQWRQKAIDWLGIDAKEVFVFEPKTKKKDKAAQLEAVTKLKNYKLVITSYELLANLAEQNHFDNIVFDECHYLETPTSARSKAAKTVLSKNPKAFLLGLTATPLSNDPANIWNQLELFYPGRFGFLQQFKKRYCEAEENKYAYSGFSYKGLNKQHSAELKSRLECVSHRATRKEVAHILPAFTVEGLQLRPKDEAIVKAAQTAMVQRKRSGIEHVSKLAFAEKCEVTIERLFEKTKSHSHVLVFTHLRESSKALFARITKEFPEHSVFHIDGGVTLSKRDETIAWAMKERQAILVTTMHAVGIGRDDLTGFTAVIGCEYDYNPNALIQMLGRFSRLSGKVPSAVELIIFKATHEEVVCNAVLEKLEDANVLYEASGSEQGLKKAFSDNMSEEDWLDKLADVASGGFDDE